MRLRHRWNPREVERWLRTDHPSVKPVSYMTLYRYVGDKGPDWFISDLVPAEGLLRRHVTRLLVLDQHAELVDAMRQRIQRAFTMEVNLHGLLMPELHANMDLLGRLLEQHLKLQQQAGVMPTSPRAPGLGEDDTGDNDDGFGALVRQIVGLPKDQFGNLLTLALGGPPEQTQPPVVEPPRVTIDVVSERVEPGEDAGAPERRVGSNRSPWDEERRPNPPRPE
jgi:hypothetical protein